MNTITTAGRVGYVLKVYPRFSETFILSEILAHERAGLDMDIFALRPSTETCFHEALSQVRSPITYLPRGSTRSEKFWNAITEASDELPGVWPTLKYYASRDVEEIEQAVILARLVVERRIGHLHAHFGTTAAGVAQLAAAMAGISYSFTAHAKDIYQQDVDMGQLQEKVAAAGTVVTVSNFNLKYLQQRFPLDAEKVRVIYNGLDLPAFPFTSNQERKPLILAVGRLVEKKGFNDLIDACGLLRDQGHDFRCEIVGQGRLYESLANRIHVKGLGSHVSILGSMSQQRVREKLSEASVLAAPCVIADDADRDGLPTVLLEAMAMGTPCVSTDVTGIPEVLKHGHTGLLVAQHNPEQLARACSQLMQDSDLRSVLAKRARALIEHQFDIDKNSSALRRVFASMNQRLQARKVS